MKITKVPGKTRPVEVAGKVQQVQVYQKEITLQQDVDVETLKIVKADLEAQLADVEAQIAEIEANP